MTFAGWDTRLLAAMGLTATPARLEFLQAWARVEGGHAAFNPLNTTMPVPAATAYNSAGVRNYPDELAGLAATLLTLRLHWYAPLRAALAVPVLPARDIAVRSRAALDTWGTGGQKVVAALRAQPRA